MRNKLTVLTIDDEELQRCTIALALEEKGYRVLEAENGRVGLEIFRSNHIDVILCDLQMPEMDGLKVVRTIATESPETPIIVVSGTGDIDDAMEAVNSGAWDYIIKPIADLSTISYIIEKAHYKSLLLQENRKYKESLEEKILERTKELQIYKTKLESLVDERTNELKESNIKLSENIEMLKHTQNQLVETEKMAALGGLVAGVAHEINTPVGVGVTAASNLSYITETIKKNYDNGTMKKSDFEKYMTNALESSTIILSNLKRASELISSFKKIAVDQTNDEIRVFNIKHSLTDIAISLYPTLKHKHHNIEIICDDDIKIEANPGAFSQIFQNLIMNAIIHAFENKQEGFISIIVETTDSGISIKFTDNGCGIEEKNIHKIFDPFFTTKRGSGGSGLGLHIIYNIIIQSLNGTITCESTVNKGTTFNITFPKRRTL